jgi:peptide/nickel transport system substrate-binding protein
MKIAMTRLLTFLAVFATLACGAPTSGPASSGPSNPSSGTGADNRSSTEPAVNRSSRTLIMAGRSEIPSLQSKPIRSFGLTSGTTVRLFNAGLALRDAQGNYHPYLAEALPQLNTDSWQVFPDGRMETTYRLKPGLVWHDGTPLSANDWVFSFQVYSVPDFGNATSPPIGLMDEVLAPDDRTIVIRWKRPYFEAGNLEAAGGTSSPSFPALPRHELEQSFRQGNYEAFANLPFWSTEFVGLGPYKLDRWEPGAFFEATAFDQHALGRPRIDRIRMLFIPDFNTTTANMLSGTAHITVDDSIRFQQGLVIRREWANRNGGTVLIYPTLWRWTQIQQRPDLARPATLRDPRVRKALAHGVDKREMGEALFEGEGIFTESPVTPTTGYFAEVDRASTKYAFDPRRVEQLMAEVGYAKGGDGIWAHPSAGRFNAEINVLQSPQNENEMHIMASTWRTLGFEFNEVVWPATASSDGQLRNTFPSLSTTSGAAGEATLAEHNSAEIPSGAGRWAGSNRGGWSNAEFDRLAQAFNTTLDRNQRVPLLVQMARIFTEDAAVISLFFNPTATAFVSGLTGPQPTVPDGTLAWNIYEWEFR